MLGRRSASITVAGLLLGASLAVAPRAAAQDGPLALAVARTQTGWVGASVAGPPGAQVTLTEQTGGVVRPLGSLTIGADGSASSERLMAWRCDRTSRTVVAAAPGAPPVSATVATPSCDARFGLTVTPRRVRVPRVIEVRVTDRWGVGAVAPRVCLRTGGRSSGCADVALRAGAATRTLRLHPIRPGSAHVTLDTPWTRLREVGVRVGPRSGRLRVLAAGDSMIQIVDGLLARRLPAARVRSDAHISTGITVPHLLDWPLRARRTARAQHPDATVVFLGANDGFGLPRPGGGAEVPCCSGEWIEAYAARARSMMRSYLRRGAGRVYWLTLPAPRSAGFARVFRGVNAALRRAAKAYPDEVRLVDTGRVLTPGGRFRRTIRRGGRTLDVRQADGVHLSVAGASIAASLVVTAMRRDGLVG